MTMEAAFDQAKKLSPIASAVALIVFAAGSYFHGQDKTDELSRRVQTLETNSVQRVEMQDLKDRLDRIESKVDDVRQEQKKRDSHR